MLRAGGGLMAPFDGFQAAQGIALAFAILYLAAFVRGLRGR